VRRFIVQADDDLIRRVRKRAAQRGVSIAQIVREALELALGDRAQPVPTFIGKYASGRPNNDSERASNDEYVADPYRSEP
jgi:plasmid stability protein